MVSIGKGKERQQKKILVVDDYLPTRNLLVEALEQTGAYEVSEAENGLDAMKLFKTGHYDMVISDIMMPGMDGMGLLNAIREIDGSVPIIMITAHPALDLTVKAMKFGAVDFLKKPFDIDELLFKVDLYLRNGSYRETAKEGYLSLQLEKEQLSLRDFIYESIEQTQGDNQTIFERIVELALRIVGGESGAILLYDRNNDDFYPQAVRSLNNGFHRPENLALLKGVFQKVVERRDALMMHSEEDPLLSPSLICAPLMIRESVLGVLVVKKKKGSGIFTKNDLHHILSLAKRASLNLENKVLYESIYASFMNTFKSLVASIQVRDHYTEEHSYRVSELAVRLAKSLNLCPKDVECLRIASLLHDVGKISIPDHILLKRGSLTPEEYAVIKRHPEIGDHILSFVVLLDREREIIRHHHEKWDGSGYPGGVAGESIPYLSRVLTVVDSFDAMVSERPYRKGMSLDRVVQEMKHNSGKQFDPGIVEVFLGIL